jgi:hypothetical protein
VNYFISIWGRVFIPDVIKMPTEKAAAVGVN